MIDSSHERVIVYDRSSSSAVGDRGIDWTAECYRKRFVRLDSSVAVDHYSEGLNRVSWREHQRAGCGFKIDPAGGGSPDRIIIHLNSLIVRARKCHRKSHIRPHPIAF